MEQMSKGQIGQPAACMIESKCVLFVRGAGFEPAPGPDYGVRTRGGPVADDSLQPTWRAALSFSTFAVDNFVDKALAERRETVPGFASSCIAEYSGINKMFKIKDFRWPHAGCEREPRRQASIGAAVELWVGAAAGFAGG